jgi:hypothetical protein
MHFRGWKAAPTERGNTGMEEYWRNGMDGGWRNGMLEDWNGGILGRSQEPGGEK